MTAGRLQGFPDICFCALPASDVSKAAALEAASYPADEAASPEQLEYRNRAAPELFYGIYEGEKLLGFIVSTASTSEHLHEEAMSKHETGGSSICIHSVVIDAAYRRRGLARAMVRAYVEAIAADLNNCGTACRMLLIAHAPLLGLYSQCGFEFIGPSAVVHGSELWFDMRLDLASKRQLEFMQVDAFSPVALAGNPAAVLFTQRNGDEKWMQAVAVENNLSETAFVEPQTADDNQKALWSIRWFTPGGEVDLCGHATLGAAHALWDSGKVPKSSQILFTTQKVGILLCSTSDSWIKLNFPVQEPKPVEQDVVEKQTMLSHALGLQEDDVLYLGYGPSATPDWLIEVKPRSFAKIKPDSSALARITPMGRGVIVTCVGCPYQPSSADQSEESPSQLPRVLTFYKNDCQFDFTSRFFAPNLGIDEDPVTGSAHCVLAPYWSQKLGKPAGTSMTALQASNRGGVLRVQLQEDSGDGVRVEVEGQAATVLRGRMAV